MESALDVIFNHIRLVQQPRCYIWNPVFKRKREVPLQLRMPHLEFLHLENELFGERDNIIDFVYQYFTATCEETDRTLYQREAMGILCPKISLWELRLRNDKAQQRLVALVDERNLSGESSYRGPLTAHQLFCLLTQGVYNFLPLLRYLSDVNGA